MLRIASFLTIMLHLGRYFPVKSQRKFSNFWRMIAATYANFENNTGKFGKPFVMTKVTLRIPYVYDFKKNWCTFTIHKSLQKSVFNRFDPHGCIFWATFRKEIEVAKTIYNYRYLLGLNNVRILKISGYDKNIRLDYGNKVLKT